MLGLALMARALAERRNQPTQIGDGGLGRIPVPRAETVHPWYSVSAEYYAIIDRITRGEKP